MSAMPNELKNVARLAAPVFLRAGWKWGDLDSGFVPDAVEIAEMLADLRIRAIEAQTIVSSGRLAVSYEKEDGQRFARYYIELGEEELP